MDEMRKQLKNKIPSCIRGQDFLTLIWFSGRGDCGTIFEHLSITDVQDLKRIHEAIDRYIHTVGSTGFVEPIRLSKKLAEAYTESPQVFFLSDGGENSWPIEECKAAFKEMVGIPVVLVEYQYYCDRALIQELAQLCEGTSIFNEDFESYDASFHQYMTNRVGATVRVPSEYPVVWMENTTLVVKQPTRGTVTVPSELTEVYALNVDAALTAETPEQVYMIMLYALTYRSTPLMNMCLAFLGDVYITKQFSTCFSKQDYSKLVEHITGCITHPEGFSFKEGLDLTFKPNDNVFNVVELLQLVQADKEVLFFPYHPSFAYQRISREQKQDDGFVVNKDIGVGFNLVFHQSRANVSLQCKLHGHDIGKYSGDVSAATAFRNFTIIKDGIKNATMLPLMLSESTFTRFVAEKVIMQSVEFADIPLTYDASKIYLVNISGVPVVNRAFFSTFFMSTEFCTTHIKIHQSKTVMKYLKKVKEWATASDAPDAPAAPADASSFRKEAPTDFYIAPELQVKIGKCSSIPTVNESLLAKLNTASKLTISETFFLPIHRKYTTWKESTDVQATLVMWIDESMKTEKETLHHLLTYTEQAKMAILIGNVWFENTPATTTTFSVPYSPAGEVPTMFEVKVEVNDIKVYL